MWYIIKLAVYWVCVCMYVCVRVHACVYVSSLEMWHPCKNFHKSCRYPDQWLKFVCLPLLNYLKFLSPLICCMWWCNVNYKKWSVHAHSKCDCPLSYMHVIEEVNGNIFFLKWCIFDGKFAYHFYFASYFEMCKFHVWNVSIRAPNLIYFTWLANNLYVLFETPCFSPLLFRAKCH